jgi:hypothetical protein
VLTLEMRGREHVRELIASLERGGYTVHRE